MLRSCAHPAALVVMLVLAAPSTSAHAEGDRALPSDTVQVSTASGMRMALLHPNGLTAPAARAATHPERSTPLAFGLSAVVPGLGQAYNRQWVKAAVALALEAALITGYSVLRRDGLDGEEAYQAFAHADWDPARYGQWVNDYKAYQNDNGIANVSAPDVVIPTGVDFQRPEAWTSAQRTAVNTFFNQIRAIERQSRHPETGASFSHQLPFFGEQQYYELIGKYFQFAPGWYDYPAWLDENGGYGGAIDPETSGPNDTKVYVSDTFYRYAREHADANDLLRRASRLSMLFVVNHLAAAIDAAVTSKLRNDRLKTDLTFHQGPDGRTQATASLQWRF